MIRPRRSWRRWSRTALPTASSTPRSSAATRPRPTPAISSSGRSPKPAATSSARNAHSTLYAQQQGIISTGVGTDGKPAIGDANSLQGESLITLNKALADATARRVAAEGAYRQGLATGPTSDVTSSTLPLRQQLATLQADYQQKRTFMKPEHPEMLSLKAADRRAQQTDRQRERPDVFRSHQHLAGGLPRRRIGGKCASVRASAS